MPSAVRALGVTRALVGVAGLVAPQSATTSLFGPAARQPLTEGFIRMAAIRDLALGLAAVAASAESAAMAARLGWLGALSDATDGAIMALTPGLSRTSRTLIVGSAVLAAGAGVAAVLRTARDDSSARRSATMGTP